MKKLISIVVPCYNEEESINLFYNEIKKIEKEMNYVNFEYIFVDDGSIDRTISIIKRLSKKDKKVKYVSLSRNFGKESAMFAGLEYSKGDFVALMDADLQDPPELLPTLYEIITKEDYDVAATRRVNRKGEPRIRSFFAKKFYRLINRLSNIEMVDGARDYRLMKRKVVNALISMKEYNRYTKGLFSFVGYKTKWVEYKNIERKKGKTKWSFWGLVSYALEGIIAFSTKPLVIAAVIGLAFFIISFAMIIFIIVRTLLFGDPVSGWPSLVCIIFFVSGVQLFSLGIIGMYLSKTYLETKNRPQYFIRETDKDA